MHLKVVFLAYLRQLHQTDQAYTRRLLDETHFSAIEVSSFMDMVGRSMTMALSELSLHPGARAPDIQTPGQAPPVPPVAGAARESA